VRRRERCDGAKWAGQNSASPHERKARFSRCLSLNKGRARLHSLTRYNSNMSEVFRRVIAMRLTKWWLNYVAVSFACEMTGSIIPN